MVDHERTSMNTNEVRT